jgi:hypothetical protein
VIRSLAAALLLSLGLAGALPAAAQAATACPSQDFKAFYAAADPEPRTVTTMLDGAALTFPVLPTAAERKRVRLETRIMALSATEAEVALAVADTDRQLRFLFRKGVACWELYRMADDSL